MEQLKSYNFQGSLEDEKADKKIFKLFLRKRIKTKQEIFMYLKTQNMVITEEFKNKLLQFLNNWFVLRLNKIAMKSY